MAKLRLHKAMSWNMPISNLEHEMYELGRDTVDKINKVIYNDFLKSNDNKVCHIRPKGRDSKNLMIISQGTYEQKPCFWLSAKYIAEQIEKES